MEKTSDWLRAFNLGCDGRVDGVPLDFNPFRGDDPALYSAWKRGWFDVHAFWGAMVRGRWPCRRLPAVVTKGVGA